MAEVESSPSGLQEDEAKPPWPLAWRLAWGQLLSWGVLYYAFTALSAPIHADTGWSRPVVHGGLSLGLLSWGVFALPVGMWIQRRGARDIMTLGSLLGGVAFASFGWVQEAWQFYLAWVAVGAAMAALLYEPAFAAVIQAFGSRFRKGIVLVTLIGGFASTVFLPVSHLLTEHFGWRQACLVLGAGVAFIGVPLHRLGIPKLPSHRDSPTPPPLAIAESLGAFRNDFRNRSFVLLALWFTLHTAVFSGLIFLIVPAMTASGAEPASLLGAMALIGPMQVLGRLLLAAHGAEFSAVRTGRWAMIVLTLSLLVLVFLPPTFGWLACFGVLFGLGNGILTILKGTAIAEFFGSERYAELNGAIAAPAMLAKAAAPLLLSAVWEHFASPHWVFVSLLCLVLVGLAAVCALGRQGRSRGG